jgi:hypothetical protein
MMDFQATEEAFNRPSRTSSTSKTQNFINFSGSFLHSWMRIRIQKPNRIQIHRIHMFLGLLDSDPLFRGMDTDPDPSISKQK